jgi:hypothetical protein
MRIKGKAMNKVLTPGFSTPVAVFIFKRFDTLIPIFNRLSEIRPQKLYLIADQGRNPQEIKEAAFVRENVDSLITWDCEVVKDFASENRGVYGNIALGAANVLKQENTAIFLEDDNLPSRSFFPFCEEMLNKYEANPDIIWVCGTNYLSSFDTENGASYVFTRQLMPCGWASWSNKFLSSYDFNLSHTDKESKKTAKKTYFNKKLYYQQLFNVEYEKCCISEKGRYYSWDYHMAWTLRAGRYYGIAPAVNLIKNIGVDSYSEHGGSSFDLEMTNRFCSMPSFELEFPLTHPRAIDIDSCYEAAIEKLLLYPFREWLGVVFKLIAFKIFKFPLDQSIRKHLLKNEGKRNEK